LSAADDLFYRRGLHAVGVDEIVARSGVAKTTLYAHFHSKDQLIASYLQHRSDDWRRFIDAALRDFVGSPAEKIDRVFELLVEGCIAPGFRGCPFINFVAEFSDPDHPGRAVCLEHRRWLKSLFAEISRDGGADQPDRLAEQLCHLYDAAMVGSQFDPAGDDADRARETARLLVGLAGTARSTEEFSASASAIRNV
jgi:AcrR family transcriptional regulator